MPYLSAKDRRELAERAAIKASDAVIEQTIDLLHDRYVSVDDVAVTIIREHVVRQAAEIEKLRVIISLMSVDTKVPITKDPATAPIVFHPGIAHAFTRPVQAVSTPRPAPPIPEELLDDDDWDDDW